MLGLLLSKAQGRRQILENQQNLVMLVFIG